MKKRLLAFVVATMMLLSALSVCATNDGIVLEVIHPEELPKAGERFEVTVNIVNNPGVCGVDFALGYDETIMDCVDARLGNVLRGTLAVLNENADSKIIVAAASVSHIEGDGTLVVCGFEAKTDISEFDFVFKEASLIDQDLKGMDFSIKNGRLEEEDSSVPDKPGTSDESEGNGDVTADGSTDVVSPGISDEDEPSADTNSPSGSSGTANSGNDESSKTDKTEQPEKDDTVQDAVAEEKSVFPDVTSHWAKAYINKAAEMELFKGDEKGNFNPDVDVTRAQFVTVLWRLAGKPEVVDETPFSDTKNQISEFKSAIAWGYKNGYINGTSETTFDPEGTLTREAAMKILHYYSGDKSGGEMSFTSIYDGMFKDSTSISSWAKKSVYWGIYRELISGTSADTLSPQNTATRAQLAKILVNYINTYNK